MVAGAMSLGSLVAFLQYMERFFLPIRDLTEKYNSLQSAMASSERIFRLLDEEEDIRDPDEPVRLESVRGEIEFDHVWFSYNPDEWVLRDVSFRVRAGESVAFVGATGAGKTSLISLMSRFYDVQKGRVLIDGGRARHGAGGPSRPIQWCRRIRSSQRHHCRQHSAARPVSPTSEFGRRRFMSMLTSSSSGCPVSTTKRCAARRRALGRPKQLPRLTRHSVQRDSRSTRAGRGH
ncbi:MAG: ABC transporter ATP-binding protein [Chloroflexia bacterium]